MDPRLLRAYDQELHYLRELGAEFAREFPAAAGRIGLNQKEGYDPYVERLLEGVAFLTARVQVRLDAEFPRFTQRLIECLYPNFFAPMPSMLVAKIEPELSDASLARGPELKRGVNLEFRTKVANAVPCHYRTAQPIRLWPLELYDASSFVMADELPRARMPLPADFRGAIRLRLRATAGQKLSNIALSSLRLYLSGKDEVPYALNELIGAAALGVLLHAPDDEAVSAVMSNAQSIRPVGFEDSEAMLPVTLRGFSGLRLMQEYFALPARFLFLDVLGFDRLLPQCHGQRLDVYFLLNRPTESLGTRVDAENFLLHCVPAINLFPHRSEGIVVSDRRAEFPIVVDRLRSLDYEVHSVTHVRGYGRSGEVWDFAPLYAPIRQELHARQGYFGLLRLPRILSEHARQQDERAEYMGSEVYLSLVDVNEAPWPARLSRMDVSVICTNRDLPLKLDIGSRSSDCSVDATAPIRSVRVVARPSHPGSMIGMPPRESAMDGAEAGVSAMGQPDRDLTWFAVDQLPLNFFSLLEQDPKRGAAALRALFRLYARAAPVDLKRHIEGLREVSVRAVTRRSPLPGPIAHMRGILVEVLLDGSTFKGYGVYLFGSLLAEYLRRYAGVNSFVETHVRSTLGGPTLSWQPRAGTRAII